MRHYKILFHEEYSRDITDVTPIMLKIHEAKPDVVFQVPYYTDSVLFARAIVDMGPGTRFWAAANETGYTDARSLETLGEDAEWFLNNYSYDISKDTYWNNKFKSDFEEAYGYLPSGVGAKLYWYMWTLKEVFEIAGREYPEDPFNVNNLKKIFDEIEITEGPAVEVFPGLSPTIAFDDKGDCMYPSMVSWQVIDGKTWVVWPTEQRTPVYPRPDYVE